MDEAVRGAQGGGLPELLAQLRQTILGNGCLSKQSPLELIQQLHKASRKFLGTLFLQLRHSDMVVCACNPSNRTVKTGLSLEMIGQLP